MIKYFLFSSLTLLFFNISANAQTPTYDWQPELETYIDGLMQEFKIPGIAIEVVNENGPVFQITKGQRNAEKNLPVTPNTLFAIGSTSKAFTGILLAQLKQEGKISFDVPVQNFIPNFRIADESASRSLTLQDLMGHWTGVGRNDFAWYHRDGLTKHNILDLIPHLPLSVQPRTEFIYNNWMWNIAGIVAETVSKKSWETLLQKNIFDALDMTSSNTSLATTLNNPDYSLPYESDGKSFQEVPFYDIAVMNPAGGIFSNLNDMAKWVQFHLNKGKVGNRTILSEEVLEETHKPYSKISDTVSYAMGWLTINFEKQKILTHDGGLDGFLSNVSFIPEKKLGVVILTGSSEIAPQQIAMRIWQYLLGVEKYDFVRASVTRSRKENEEAIKKYPDTVGVSLDRPIEFFVGDFCNPLYGKATISKTNDQTLHLKMNLFDIDLYSTAPLKFSIRNMHSELKYINFKESADREISSIQWQLESSSNEPVVFQRCLVE